MKDPAKVKSKAFGLRIIKLYKYLCEEKKEYVLSKQVLRSGTSIGANLAEAKHAISKRDFLSKVYVALKESAETEYWLEMLNESGYIDKKSFESIYADCQEIIRILVSTTKTIEEELNRK
ncbi:MAG: four helix bundle protein [Flexilinea sp.]|nr:four helix bundle protein [Flexilinea sp.]